MVIKEVTVQNFNNFIGKHTFTFSNLNLIKGKNGTGKSTIGLDSILFALYGYSDKKLSELPNKSNKSTTCSVTVTIAHLLGTYKVLRKYPTDITIWLDDNKIELGTNVEKQRYLNILFKDVEYFRKFRMLDVKQGINILEQGKVALKKTLLSFNEEMFNRIRKSLQDKKHEREIYNKDTAVVIKHYPSYRRYEILAENITKLSEEEDKELEDFGEIQEEIREISRKIGRISGDKSRLYTELNTLKTINLCPTCKQNVSEEHKKSIVIALDEALKVLEVEDKNTKEEYQDIDAQADLLRKRTFSLRDKKRKLENLKFKLDSRFKQKDFIWTKKDVLVIKQAIAELDKFCAFYIKEWVKILEPIINNITTKIGFVVEFDLTEKGDFDIKLFRDKTEYTYKDLSDGQKLILTIAFQIAILLEHGLDGVIIADEGFSSLDDDNLTQIFRLFEELPFQLICIIHRFDEPLTTVKTIDLGEMHVESN